MDYMRLYRDKIRRAKAQLRLNLIRRSGNNVTVHCILLRRYPLLQRQACGGSLLQTCTPNTLSFQIKYYHNIYIHYISKKCLAHSWLFQ